MKKQATSTGLIAIIWLLASTVPSSSSAETVSVGAAATERGLATTAWDSLNLRRGVAEFLAGDLPAARGYLEQIDLRGATRFAGAERAAFLLAVVSLQLQDEPGFAKACTMAAADSPNPFRQWLAYLQLLVGDETAVGQGQGAAGFWQLPGTSVLMAATLLSEGQVTEAGNLLAKHAAEPDLRPAHEYLQALAAGDTTLARRLLAADGGDARRGPAWRSRQQHLGQRAAEAGQRQEQLAHADSALVAWHLEASWLAGLTDDSEAAAAWQLWTRSQVRTDEIALPPLAWDEVLAEMTAAATDLTRRPQAPREPRLRTAGAGLDPRAAYARANQPTTDQWQLLTEVIERRQQASAQALRAATVVARLERAQERRLAYLQRGRAKAVAGTIELDRTLADLSVLLGRLGQALSELDRTREAALAQFVTRGLAVGEDLRTSLLYLQAVRQFHVAGPAAVVPPDWPADVPTPAELLDLESALARETLAFLELFSERVPELVNRSCREIWVPRLAGDGTRLQLALRRTRDRQARLVAGVDSTAQNLPGTVELAQARQTLALRLKDVAGLRQTENDLRQDIVAEVVARGERRLEREREGLTYLRSDAAYWLAVGLRPDPGDTAARTEARAAVNRARTWLQDDLQRYPAGRARAENRFRLADLELLRARDDFQTHMAAFLGQNPTADELQNKAMAPFVDYAPAAALYRTMLAEDADYPHRAAVLFQLGMILGDAGQSDAGVYLAELVTGYPDAPYVQEAALRLGDQHFAAREFAASGPWYAIAADGEDPGLKAIALYKLGWSNFEQDDFAAATTAFGQLLDHYETGTGAAVSGNQTDLAAEAQEYLVHALIRSGGAEAFVAHFAAVGPRAYESDILRNMAHELSGVSLYRESIACDQLWLDRFGGQEQALAVAERLVASYRRWHKPDQARVQQMAQADRFLPGSAWNVSHPAERWQQPAAAFAAEAYQRTAVHEHQQARETGDTESWRRALGHYEDYLRYWPEAAAAPRLHLQAGEAAAELEQFATALKHFESAAATDTAGFVREANWQIVAVSDAWYRTSVPQDTESAGSDSLARRLLSATDVFEARYPADEHLPDLLWRRGQVAYAHGWFAEAATTFTALADQHPGDKRALAARRFSGDAWYQTADFAAAGAAYQRTLALARTERADSVAAAVAPLLPQCEFKQAQQVAGAETGGAAAAAPIYAALAVRWPEFQYADLAWYKAGLGREEGGQPTAAVEAWEALLEHYPASEYARDSALRIAAAHESAGRTPEAASALVRFSALFPEDPDAAAALLKAGDMLAAAGDQQGAEELRTTFLARFPAAVASGMEIRAERAERALAALPADASPDALVPVQEYLALAAAHPDQAEAELTARVAYLRARSAHAQYDRMTLTQPLPAALAAKQASLEEVLALYAACARQGEAEYARAAAFGIGEAVTAFGDALLASERPAGLRGDDLLAYEEVLTEQSWPFYDRGEAAWTELLQQTTGVESDPGGWLARTQAELWPRVAQRFMHMTETEYPLVAAIPPAGSE